MDLQYLLPVPFLDQGRDLSGLDCWGLAIEVFKQFGQELPDFRIKSDDEFNIDAMAIYKMRTWPRVDNPSNSDAPLIVAIKNNPKLVNHVGVYIGDGRIIHIMKKTGVTIQKIEPFLKPRIAGFFKLC